MHTICRRQNERSINTWHSYFICNTYYILAQMLVIILTGRRNKLCNEKVEYKTSVKLISPFSGIFSFSTTKLYSNEFYWNNFTNSVRSQLVTLQ